MLKFKIGEYFEIYQHQETSHREDIIEAETLEEAKAISKNRYGWGSWAYPLTQIQEGGNGSKPKER